MSDFAQAIAPQTDTSDASLQEAHTPPEPAPITEQEVGEYREQDRYLPVSSMLLSPPIHLLTAPTPELLPCCRSPMCLAL